MLFHTLRFFEYFIPGLLLYWALPQRYQNYLLLFCSYLLYSTFSPEFTWLLFVSTVTDYLCALRIQKTDDPRRRKAWLILTLLINFSILGIFKYYNFFIDNAAILLSSLGMPVELFHLELVLPVGISFYTFQSVSYTIDVYRRKVAARTDFNNFALYVAFFPQLLAGPIERSAHLLPQIEDQRKLTYQRVSTGVYLIFWGIVEKIAVADTLSSFCFAIFNNPQNYHQLELFASIVGISIVLYADFDGYSNIAKGFGSLLGFDIMTNFNAPFFATNPAELWRRWHISLTSWFFDYVYQPLGGSRLGNLMTARNLVVTFVLVGLWHGAAWTFILWGLASAIVILIYRALRPAILRFWPKSSFGQKVACALATLVAFSCWIVQGIPFFSTSLEHAWQIYSALFGGTGVPFEDAAARNYLYLVCLYSTLPFFVQWLQYRSGDTLALLKAPIVVRVVFYTICFYLLVSTSEANIGNEYIYFRF